MFRSMAYQCIVNGCAAAIFMILCIRFSSAHASYAMGLFMVLFLCDLWRSYRKGCPLFGQLTAAGKKVAYGICGFYIMLLAGSLCLMDKSSFAVGAELAALAVPFFMFLFLRSKYDVDCGMKLGILASSTAIVISSVYLHGFAFLSDPSMAFLHDRYTGFFAHPNHLGTALAMLWPFCGCYFLGEKNIGKRMGLGILLLAMLFCLYATGSRGAIVAFAGGLILAGCGLFGLRRHVMSVRGKRMLLGGLLLICLIVGSAFGWLQINRNEWGKGGGERMLMMKSSFEMWRDHPLLGIGLANWQTYYYSEEYHPAEGRENALNMPHNMPTYFFSTAGTLGGMAYLLFLALSFWGIYRTAAQTKNDGLAVAAMAAFWAFTLQGLVDTTIINKIPARIYFALMGYYLASGINWQREKKRVFSEEGQKSGEK